MGGDCNKNCGIKEKGDIDKFCEIISIPKRHLQTNPKLNKINCRQETDKICENKFNLNLTGHNQIYSNCQNSTENFNGALELKKKKSSIFSTRLPKTKLIVHRRKFLAGDNLTFDLTCKNCFNLVQISVNFIQKIVKNDKTSLNFVVKEISLGKIELGANDLKRSRSGEGRKEKIELKSGFLIPNQLIPNVDCRCKKSIRAFYSVEFVIDVEGKTGYLKGHIPILIEDENERREFGNECRSSNCNKIPPPPYSTLDRRDSRELPPSYDEALDLNSLQIPQ